MIEIRNLTKYYGSFAAVRDLNLEIPTGQVVGLLGPNGAGKTTTIRILTGYMPPTTGSVSVDGFDSVTQSDEVRRRLGYLPESNPLYPEMRVAEYLHFRGRMFGLTRDDRRAAVDRVIERCWLGEMRRRQIGRLSKGYRQRVGLAAALLHNPPLLVLDEPTSGLDPVQIRETRRLIRELAGDHTMVLSSHILPEVELTVDRIVIIARGERKVDGTPSELREQAGAAHRYIIEVELNSASDVSSHVSSMKGVSQVREGGVDNGWSRLEVDAKASAGDLREPIASYLHAQGVKCRELHRESASLEQLFIRVTAGDMDIDNNAPVAMKEGA